MTLILAGTCCWGHVTKESLGFFLIGYFCLCDPHKAIPHASGSSGDWGASNFTPRIGQWSHCAVSECPIEFV